MPNVGPAVGSPAIIFLNDRMGHAALFSDNPPGSLDMVFDLSGVVELTEDAINGLDTVYYRQRLFLRLAFPSPPHLALYKLDRIRFNADTYDGYWTYLGPPREKPLKKTN